MFIGAFDVVAPMIVRDAVTRPTIRGAIDRLLCNKRLWSGKKTVDFERKNDGNNASSKTETKTEDNDTKTEDNDVVVSPSAVVDTAAI